MSDPNVTIRFSIKYDGNAINDAKSDFQKILDLTKASAVDVAAFKEKLDFSQIAQAGYVLSSSLESINGVIARLTNTYAIQEVAESKLAAVMKNTMGATDEDVEAIKRLASAQQELGVIGDEVQLAGAQELSTYLSLRSSLETLVPVMNDMIAQQYGLGATQENAASIATMLGKVMEGQVSGLSRYGYYFDEAQEAVLKFGTEEEKAAVLASVVEQSVGGMNASLAATSSGRMQQLSNYLGDVKEKMGEVVTSAQPVISVLNECFKVIVDIGNVGNSLISISGAYKRAGAFLGKYKKELMGAAAAEKASAAATKMHEIAQKALNIALSNNPIGIVVKALAGLALVLTIAYNTSDEFREVCNSLWTAVKDLGTAVLNFLAPAFRKAGEAISFVWGYLKSLLGLSDTSSDVTRNYTNDLDENAAAALANADAYMDLAKAGGKAKNSIKDVSDAITEGSLDYYQKQVSDIEKLINSSRPEDRPALLSRLEIAEGELKKAQDFLDLQKFSIRYTIKPEDRVGRDKITPNANFNLNPAEDLKTSPFKIITWTEVYNKAIEDAKKKNEDFVTSTDLVAGAFNNIGKSVGGAAGAFLEWGANVASAIATAIPQIMALTSVSEAEGQAAGKSAALQGAAAVAGTPVVGPALAIAAAASIVAALMAIPKFATGGIAYGPTLGLFGEYSGASSNPEVVAPLDRLRSMIQPSDGVGGKVEFVIDGRVLRGVLRKTESLSTRS